MSVDRRLTRISATALLCGVAAPALAAPQLHPMLADRAVIQRGEPVRISGSASPGERLTISFAGTSANTRADRQGRWSAQLPPMQAGGPYTLQVQGAGGSSATTRDILVGDVWLCSGQSNMEWPLSRALQAETEIARASDPQLRIVTIAKQTSATPKGFAEAPKWDAVTPETIREFSAACYYMTRELRKTQNVPIGAIDATWGGTPIRAWMDLPSLRASGEDQAAGLVELYRSHPAKAEQAFGDRWTAWWRKQTGEAAGQEVWRNGSRLQWKPFPSFGIVDNWDPSFVEWNGSFWARRSVTLSAEEAKQDATLALGVIDDVDRAFVNGVGVGSTNSWDKERNYPVPAAVLKPGANEIMVYVRDSWGPGGFRAPPEAVKLRFADGREQPLGSGWEYSLIDDAVGSPPSPPWEGHSGASTIYNGMIAPLGPIALRGVAWYQGETDVGQPGYDKRLAGLFGNWRRQFRDPKLPFLVVGLAAFGTPRSTPFDSGWAQVVDEQRAAVQRDAAAGFVPAIDLGEWFDIHPANKLDVGKRLAWAAQAVAYRDQKGKLSPLPLSATRNGENIVVTFSKGLQTLNGASAIGFELCGEAQGSCRFRDGRINGNQIVIAGDGQAVTRVRFAWADAPIVNLYDTDLLPASSFELKVD